MLGFDEDFDASEEFTDDLPIQPDDTTHATDFPRRIMVRDGFIEFHTSFPTPRPSNPILWVPSTFLSISSELFLGFSRLRQFSFEFRSHLQCIETTAFRYSGLTQITIPASVAILCRSCFKYCQSLKCVAFESPSVLSTIEDQVFAQSGLESVILPASVTFLGSGGFCDDNHLVSLVFERGSMLRQIRSGCFHWNGFEKLVIPSSVESIEMSAFNDCYWLKSIEFESSEHLQRIEAYAFNETRLTAISLPNSLCVIIGSAFNIESLESVCFFPSPISFDVRDGMIESVSGSLIVRYFGKIRLIWIAHRTSQCCARMVQYRSCASSPLLFEKRVS
jgi:hypothetical protein